MGLCPVDVTVGITISTLYTGIHVSALQRDLSSSMLGPERGEMEPGSTTDVGFPSHSERHIRITIKMGAKTSSLYEHHYCLCSIYITNSGSVVG
jgi:hypothetical protein